MRQWRRFSRQSSLVAVSSRSGRKLMVVFTMDICYYEILAECGSLSRVPRETYGQLIRSKARSLIKTTSGLVAMLQAHSLNKGTSNVAFNSLVLAAQVKVITEKRATGVQAYFDIYKAITYDNADNKYLIIQELIER